MEKLPQLKAWQAVLGYHAEVIHHIEQALHRQGLIPLAWYDVLIELHGVEKLTQNEISRRCLLTKSGISRTIATLEANGLVRRQADTRDKRIKYTSLTAEGREALRRAWPVYRDCLKKYFPLSAEEAGTVEKIFKGLRAPFAQSEGGD